MPSVAASHAGGGGGGFSSSGFIGRSSSSVDRGQLFWTANAAHAGAAVRNHSACAPRRPCSRSPSLRYWSSGLPPGTSTAMLLPLSRIWSRWVTCRRFWSSLRKFQHCLQSPAACYQTGAMRAFRHRRRQKKQLALRPSGVISYSVTSSSTMLTNTSKPLHACAGRACDQSGPRRRQARRARACSCTLLQHCRTGHCNRPSLRVVRSACREAVQRTSTCPPSPCPPA